MVGTVTLSSVLHTTPLTHAVTCWHVPQVNKEAGFTPGPGTAPLLPVSAGHASGCLERALGMLGEVMRAGRTRVQVASSGTAATQINPAERNLIANVAEWQLFAVSAAVHASSTSPGTEFTVALQNMVLRYTTALMEHCHSLIEAAYRGLPDAVPASAADNIAESLSRSCVGLLLPVLATALTACEGQLWLAPLLPDVVLLVQRMVKVTERLPAVARSMRTFEDYERTRAALEASIDPGSGKSVRPGAPTHVLAHSLKALAGLAGALCGTCIAGEQEARRLLAHARSEIKATAGGGGVDSKYA